MFKLIEREFTNYLVVDLQRSASTTRNHRCNYRYIKEYFENKEFNLENVKDLLAQQKQRGLSEGTIQNFIYTLRILSDFLVLKGLIDENFCNAPNINLPKRKDNIPDVLTSDELQRIINAQRQTKYGEDVRERMILTNQLIIELMIKTGCRIGEAINIKVCDVTLDDNTPYFKVRESKTKKQRFVPLPLDMIKRLRQLINYTNSPNDFIFRSFRGNKINKDSVRFELLERAKIAGIRKKVYPHLLRHSFITELLRKNTSIILVANIVGHSDLDTTQQYTHLIVEDMHKAQSRHPLINRKPRDMIREVKNAINDIGIDSDDRLNYSIEEKNNSLTLSISIV